MWAHRPWVGRHLPGGTPHGSELAAYARLLNAVEGNTTFYATPTATTVDRWREQAGEGFRFVCKVPREVTHERRLREVEPVLHPFLDVVEPLHEVVGALAIQLPASFAPVDLPVLGALLRDLPAAWRWAVEVRHPGFFDGPARAALDDLLAGHGVERVLMDTRTLFAQLPASEAEREAWASKPRVPALAEALTDEPIVRFVGVDDPARTIAGWQPWLPVIAAWLHEGRRPTVFVHTPDNLDAPALARELHAQVTALVPALRPLPVPPAVDGDVVQATLF